MNATLIKTDGTKTILENPTFDDIQKAIGGYVAIAATVNDQYLIVDEDGILKNLEPNSTYPQYVGNVVIADRGLFS